MKEKKITMKQMCEEISQWLKDGYCVTISPKELWESSPTGEVWHLFYLYDAMKATK